ncbi:Peptidase family M1 [Streptomyces sp. WMMB 714]|uniref:M1 family metallopeptidase n=1 Tax=Streptomyces sp. WMMB 714 TaxID=1286822 RepID=UPI000823F650|nr:M1 family metallopeptidase [Streptomyces sp. WMMB 714]SCK33144.1 Peptidase family M1 [Streptomyces sp. WMMB 714]
MRHRLMVPGAVLAALLTAVPASAAEPSPGAPGAGDAYYPAYGNGGYDVSHYDLRLKYQPKSDELSGTATLLAESTQELSRFNLDFALDVSAVHVNGRKASFETSGDHELEVTPAQPIAKGEDFTVVVRYSGVPSEVEVDGFTSWHRTPDGAVAANEPESAWWWYPSNDHPSDKATFDVSIAVPEGYQSLSNGRLVSERESAGWVRTSWRSSKPQATYLATLAVGKFDLTKSTTESGIPVVNAYSKGLGDEDGSARASVERTAEITDWLEGVFGTYPFESVGGYVPDTGKSFALETQTMAFYGNKRFKSGTDVSVVVHEVAHQWYGDSVSVRNWKDIWLNEGFASYASWLWSEEQGEGTAQELAEYAYESYPAGDEFWKVKPGDPGPENQFHGAVYDRGAMALQALRNKIGDKDFFAILKGWPSERSYGNARLADFEKYAEKVSGESLGKLFDTWLHTASRPSKPALGGVKSERGEPVRPESWDEIQAVNGSHRH